MLACFFDEAGIPERLISRFSYLGLISILLFTSLLAIPLARQGCLDATLLTGLQIVGVTLDFLDDVLLLYLSLKPAQRIFERLAFLNANLCQKIHLQTCQTASMMILEVLEFRSSVMFVLDEVSSPN